MNKVPRPILKAEGAYVIIIELMFTFSIQRHYESVTQIFLLHIHTQPVKRNTGHMSNKT